MTTNGFWKRSVLLASAGLALLALACPATAKQSTESRSLPALAFLPPGGIFTNSVAVRIIHRSPSAIVRVTLDGSEPVETSAIGTNVFVVTNSMLIKARIFEPGLPPGEVVSQNYTLLDSSLADFTSNLPLVIINAFGQEVSRDARVPVSVRIVDATGGRSALAGPPQFDGRAFFSLHGRSSLRYPKHSYNLKIIDDSEEQLKVSLLGLPKDCDWILYAPYPDKTLMRDVLAYELSNQMGRYATRTKYVEVFVNESGGKLTEHEYLGVYVLEERIKPGPHRVDIQKLKPDDLTEPNVTGGYIFKKDHVDRPEVGPGNVGGFPEFVSSSANNRTGFPTGPGGFPADPVGFLPPYLGSTPVRDTVTSSRSPSSSRREILTNQLGVTPKREALAVSRAQVFSGDGYELSAKTEGFRTLRATNHLYFVEPQPEELNAVQRAWLINYLNQFESVLYGPNFKNPTNGYAAYIDAGSFIDHHLLVETTKNVDGFRFSTFFFKDRGGQINLGPIWDWNLSLGNASHGKQGWLPQYWLWPQLDNREYSWFRRLFEDPDFAQKYVDRWAELRNGALATSNILARIDELAQQLNEAQGRNFKRWPILGVNVHPNWYVGNSFADEVNWMKQWLQTRLDWLERQFLAPPVLQRRPGSNSLASSVSAEVKAGKIYYTLDGSDPRAPGGALASKAIEYHSPLPVKPDLQVMARARQDNRWSSPARLQFLATAASAK